MLVKKYISQIIPRKFLSIRRKLMSANCNLVSKGFNIGGSLMNGSSCQRIEELCGRSHGGIYLRKVVQ